MISTLLSTSVSFVMRSIALCLALGIFASAIGKISCDVDEIGRILSPETAQSSDPWWRHTVVYQIYPRSFQDSDGDGVGDLKGIESRLDHFTNLGVETIWMSPIFESPMKDFGYDVSNFTNIDPLFGTLQDFDDLVAAAQVEV